MHASAAASARRGPIAAIGVLATLGAAHSTAQVTPRDGVWCGATSNGTGISFVVANGEVRGGVGVRDNSAPPQEALLAFLAPVVASSFIYSYTLGSPSSPCRYFEGVAGAFSAETSAACSAGWGWTGRYCPFPPLPGASDSWIADWAAPVATDLAVSLSTPAQAPEAGATLDLPIVIRNLGPADTPCFKLGFGGNGLNLQPRFPSGSVFNGIWAGPPMAAGAQVGGMVHGSSAPDATDLAVSATVGVVEGIDPVPTNNTASVTVSLQRRADLAIDLRGPSAFTAPATLSYLVRLQQKGPSVAPDTRVDLTIDPPLTLLGVTKEVGGDGSSSCASPCRLGDLLPSEARVRFDFDAPSSLVPPQRYIVTASASSQSVDPLPDDNRLSLTTTHLAPAPPSSFYPLAPCRLLDTRDSTMVCDELELNVSGACGVPDTAGAVALNVTVVGAIAPGHLTLYPAGFPEPPVSALNFGTEQVRANNAIIGLRPRGGLTLRPHLSVQGFFSCVHAIVDVTGYFQ